MGRLLAVLAAVAMVAGSIAIRSRLDDDGGGGLGRDQPLRLSCPAELADACGALAAGSDRPIDVTSEEATATAGRLSEATTVPPTDGWLVPRPWADMVVSARERAARPRLFEVGKEPLARSPVVLVVPADRAQVLRTRCPEATVGWRCLGEVAAAGRWTAVGGRPEWGPVKPGHASPHTGSGLVVVGSAAVGFFGNNRFSLADLETDEFLGWFGGLERAVPPGSGPSPLNDLLVKGPAAYDAVGTLEAETRALLTRAARRSQLEVLYPAPIVSADLVLATARTERGDDLAAIVEREAPDLLKQRGWRLPGDRGRPPLPKDDGLPGSGVVAAVRTQWEAIQ